MVQVRANNLSFEVERLGPESGVPVVLIPGYGTQLISWPEELIERLAGHGCSVLLLDNRDAGLSEKLHSVRKPDVSNLRQKTKIAAAEVPYTIRDMGQDVAALLDTLGIARAHIVGKSMGGLIAQALAADHPEKIMSLTLIFSTSGSPSLPAMQPEIEAVLFEIGAGPVDRENAIELSVAADRLWASPSFPFDADDRRAQAAIAFDRCHDPQATARQAAALLQWLRSGKEPPILHVPALIIHGLSDTIFPPEHGRDLHRRIAGSRLVEIEGMGHDLEGDCVPMVADHLLRFIEATVPPR